MFIALRFLLGRSKSIESYTGRTLESEATLMSWRLWACVHACECWAVMCRSELVWCWWSIAEYGDEKTTMK